MGVKSQSYDLRLLFCNQFNVVRYFLAFNPLPQVIGFVMSDRTEDSDVHLFPPRRFCVDDDDVEASDWSPTPLRATLEMPVDEVHDVLLEGGSLHVEREGLVARRHHPRR